MIQPWTKRKRESGKAFEAFDLYIKLGLKRTCKAVADQLGKSETLIHRWCGQHFWRKRADAFDRWQADIQEEAIREAARTHAAKWAKRAEEIKDKEWEMADKLEAKAEQMLKLPVIRQEKAQDTVEEKDKDGRPVMVKRVTVINPGKCTMDTARGYLETAAKLRRMATGQATEQTAIQAEVTATVQQGESFDLEELARARDLFIRDVEREITRRAGRAAEVVGGTGSNPGAGA